MNILNYEKLGLMQYNEPKIHLWLQIVEETYFKTIRKLTEKDPWACQSCLSLYQFCRDQLQDATKTELPGCMGRTSDSQQSLCNFLQ